MTEKILALAVFTLAAGLVAGPAIADVAVPYGSTTPGGVSGFKYIVQPVRSEIPGFEAPNFDDSAWEDGATPFGGNGGASEICPSLWSTVQTLWTPVTDLFVRFNQEFCADAHNVRVSVSIDNDISLFVNGFEVAPVGGCAIESLDGLCQTEGCAVNDKLTYDVDALLVPGSNAFAIHARDREHVSFLDVQITADLSSLICTPPNDPPTCDGAFADPGQLWPPNHKWSSIAIGGLTDPNGDDLAVVIDSIFQDEPTDAKGNGDGNTCPDGAGIGTSLASVRAERAGGLDGRVYHIGFTATDPSGATCQGAVGVCVPHDQGQGDSCIDQGALYNSTVCK